MILLSNALFKCIFYAVEAYVIIVFWIAEFDN